MAEAFSGCLAVDFLDFNLLFTQLSEAYIDTPGEIEVHAEVCRLSASESGV